MHRIPRSLDLALAPPLLAGLPRSELAALLARSPTRQIRAGELLFREGEEPEGLVAVTDGAGEIFRMVRGRGRARLGEFEPGDVLAVASTLTGMRHLATARALVPTEILRISRPDVRRLCRRHPEIALRLEERMELRLTGLVRRLAWLAGRAAPERGPRWALRVERSA